MKKIASYILSAYSFVFKYPLEKLLDVGYQSKNGNPIPSFDEKLLINLCLDAQNIFQNERNLLEIEGDLIIVGDIHGNLHDLLRILHFYNENQSKVLFLGDFVDRGEFSLECITILFALKVIRPDLFYLIRGNHEFDSVCSQYGFKEEILQHHNRKKMKNNQVCENISDILITQKKEKPHNNEEQNKQYEEYLADHKDMDCYKYSEALYKAFIDAFAYLPIGAIVNGSTFCIHGGLSPRMDHIDMLTKSINRPIYNFEENELLSDVVWSDPSGSIQCLYGDNPRGRGYMFSRSAVTIFLLKNSIKRIIRGHECVKNGSYKHFNETLITIFSASSYDRSHGNCSAVLKLFQKDDTFKISHFDPLDKLQKCDASFYKVQIFDCDNEVKVKSFFSFHHPFLASNAGIRMVTNKKIGSIPAQRSHHSISLNLLNERSRCKGHSLISSSVSLLPRFNNNNNNYVMCKHNSSFLEPLNEELDSNDQICDD